MFTDLIVVDASTVLAGPSVGTFFAELGAKVIKVENSNSLDVTRTWKLPSEDKRTPLSAYFASVNYGKKYIQLDLRIERDYLHFLELMKVADVLITNFKNGDDQKLQIEDHTLRKHNKRLIIGKINGFGQESDRVAYDLILQAETGFMSMNGTAESGPVKMPVALIDVLAAHHLKEGLLLALLKRKDTGSGETITVSLYDAAVASLINQASNFLMNHHVPEPIGSLHPNIAPYGELFHTLENDTITFAIGSDVHFRKLCNFIQLPELANHAKYASNQDRVLNRIELQKELSKIISTLPTQEILSAMHALNVPVGMVKNLKQVFENKNLQDTILHEEIAGIPTQRLSSIAFRWE
jgi:crotonobetainyl-CoA:carnitine CoA-transferase CaiB-like acyl-CoA transferase